MIKPLPGYGPAPVRGTDGAGAISGQRAAVLERLQQHHEPVRIAELADELALHGNTVREHLEALVDRGLAVRERAAAQGRGRPAWLFSAAADNAEPDPRVRDYAGLAMALSGHLVRTSDDPARDALAAGREWGLELAAERGADHPPAAGTVASAREIDTGTAPRRRVVNLLDGLGFDPDADADATTAALRRCPLLDAATRYPEVVCQVHLGIVRGALEVFGGDPDASDLLPFSEPGACRLHLTAPPHGPASADA